MKLRSALLLALLVCAPAPALLWFVADWFVASVVLLVALPAVTALILFSSAVTHWLLQRLTSFINRQNKAA